MNTQRSTHNATVHTFPGPGYILADVPQDVRNVIQEEVDGIENSTLSRADATTTLAGKIKQEYFLIDSKDKTEPFIFDLIDLYKSSFGFQSNFNRFKLTDMWVNFQKKYEYNPTHAHSGVFSFVIWVRIPYDLEEEVGLFNNTNDNYASMFSFYYANSLGEIKNQYLPISKEWEWKCAFFPAVLRHGVYPFFTSDGTRISVSGNIKGF